MNPEKPPKLISSYDPQYFTPLFEAEERHFWFRSRNRVISILLRRFLGTNLKSPKLLEIGCGNGNVLRHLSENMPNLEIFGMDLFANGLRHAQFRVGCCLVQADIQHPPFHQQFDAVGLFDVIEHLDNDLEILVEIRNLLKPGGKVFITVPAFTSLWSYFDEASHHVRRYSKTQLIDKLQQSGFRSLYISHTMMLLFPMVWLQRKIAISKPKSEDEIAQKALGELRIVPVINPIITALLGLEAAWIAKGYHLPFGTSLVAIAEKE